MVGQKKIIVVQIGKLGDMVLTTPLFYELNKHFPDYELYVLASEINHEIPFKIPFIKKTYIFKKNIFLFPLLIKLKSLKIDILIDIKPEFSKTGKLLLNFIKPKFSMGFNSEENIYSVNLGNFSKGNHFVDFSLSPLYSLVQNFESEFRKPVLISKNTNLKYDLVINVSSGMKIRNWSMDYWIEVIKYCEKLNLKIGVIYDKYQIDSLKYLIKYFNGKINLIKPDLESKISAVSGSKLVISTDTSIIHIASAFNRPVIGLYTKVNWNLERFKPLSEIQKILISDSPDSVNSIKPEEVIDSINELRNEGVL